MIAPEDSPPPDISTLDRFVKITTAAKLLQATQIINQSPN